MVVYKITVIDSRELTRTDIWGAGLRWYVFIEGFLMCVAIRIATDLCVKTSYTGVMACVQKQHKYLYCVIY